MSRLGQPTQRFEYVINTLEEELSQSKKELASVKEALSVNDDENGGWDAYYTAELEAKKMRFEDEVSDFQDAIDTLKAVRKEVPDVENKAIGMPALT